MVSLVLPILLAQLSADYLGGEGLYRPASVLPTLSGLSTSVSSGYLATPSGNVAVTTTRASSATHVVSGSLVTVSSNVGRYDASNALLVEQAGTNLLLRSEEFDNASWTKGGGATVTANSTAAPDGNTTAETFARSAGSAATSFVYRTATITSGQPVAHTVFAKRNNTDWVYFLVTNVAGTDEFGSWFNLATCAVGTSRTQGSGTFTQASVASLSSGWCRLAIGGTIPGTTSVVGHVPAPVSGDGLLTITGGMADYVWGADLKQGATFPSSYVATTNATATRAAETHTAPLANGPTTNGSACVTYTPLYGGTSSADRYLLDMRVAGNATGWALYRDTANKLSFVGRAGGAGAAFQSAALTWTAGTATRVCANWTGTSVTLTQAGTSVGNGTITAPGALNANAYLGSDNAGASQANGYLSSFCVSPRYGGCQ